MRVVGVEDVDDSGEGTAEAARDSSEQLVVMTAAQDCTVRLWTPQGGFVGSFGRDTWRVRDASTFGTVPRAVGREAPQTWDAPPLFRGVATGDADVGSTFLTGLASAGGWDEAEDALKERALGGAVELASEPRKGKSESDVLGGPPRSMAASQRAAASTAAACRRAAVRSACGGSSVEARRYPVASPHVACIVASHPSCW